MHRGGGGLPTAAEQTPLEAGQIAKFTRRISSAPAPQALGIPTSAGGGEDAAAAAASLLGNAGIRFAPPPTISSPLFPSLPGQFQAPLSGTPFDLFGGTGAAGSSSSGGATAAGVPTANNALLNALSTNPLLMQTLSGLMGGGGSGSGGLGNVGAAGAASDAGGGSAALGGLQQPLAAAMANPLQLLGQSGSTLEQITSMARNLIQLGGGENGQLVCLRIVNKFPNYMCRGQLEFISH